jgi:hypothetical protein
LSDLPNKPSAHNNPENVFLSPAGDLTQPALEPITVTVIDEEAVKRAVDEAKKEAQVKLKKEHFKLVRL